MDIKEFLNKFKEGKVSLEETETYLKNLPYEDLDYAKLDYHRSIRSGFGEVIFCEGKADEHLLGIYKSFSKREGNVLGTRASSRQYELIKKEIPDVLFDEISGVLKIDRNKKNRIGKIVVATGGTADIRFAEEAAQTAEFFGANVDRLYDVGISGLHRLLNNLNHFKDANAIIAVAGMEGALPGVIAGLVDVPVIALPTSVGYGANFKGVSALLTMLNSCAEGINVVNIDNGFGAGYNAAQINRLVERHNGY
ncbi:nickel pincer cofactor biosynthesis protein LarB [Peptoniphilus duerdenii]|uniref:nickel pincer cofactor biosynthesis protein LarB n=1 Tax=Peptoniphilus duerdenii TaxID=507750 RepID=UPI002889FC93|nr:nickel pincer cofactor biosynthesis protein LarB [Peptoniphilus duerdenii]